MSVSLKESYDIAYDGSENAARMDLFIDTSADLAGLTHFDSIKLLQGSTAEDISTGDKYMMQTGGTWVLQPSSNVFSNVYTKAEIDAIIANYYTSAQTDEYYQWVIVTIDTDVLPLAFLSDGTPLTAWSISGNMVQTGTPTPSAPITPEECGNLVESGEHAGEYAVPIALAGQTQTVYLSEPLRKIGDYADTVASDGTVTRRIGKVVLSGQETGWGTAGGGAQGYLHLTNTYNAHDTPQNLALSSHYSVAYTVTSQNLFGLGALTESPTSKWNGNIIFYIYGTGIDAFKEFLAEQYSAGTPVCIWYVLANPVTETFDAPTITPQKGSNTLTVNTTLPPSEVSITGGIREGV